MSSFVAFVDRMLSKRALSFSFCCWYSLLELFRSKDSLFALVRSTKVPSVNAPINITMKVDITPNNCTALRLVSAFHNFLNETLSSCIVSDKILLISWFCLLISFANPSVIVN